MPLSSEVTETALTFDDILLVPAYSEVIPAEISTHTQLTNTMDLSIPLLSSAMDTVTESRMAIAVAQAGGMGIIHKNLTPEEQAEEVNKVKRHESGILKSPITISPDTSVKNLLLLSNKYMISGFPVVENKRLVGIVTNRDIRFETNLDQPVSNIMTPKERLITINEKHSLDKAKLLIHEHKLERILIVNDDFFLVGLITVKDIKKATDYPHSSKDSQGRLRVGAAIGIAPDTYNRIEQLIQEEVDVLCIDTAHAHSKKVIEVLRWIKKHYTDTPVIVGNIVTGHAALMLADEGADAVKVGIGPGSICTTRIISGAGMPQVTAIRHVAEALKDTNIKIIADGGIRYSGDITKAIASGAHCVMLGSLFAGTDEAPGEVILYQGRSYKSYRGMGSISAMKDGSSDRYFQENVTESKIVPEGIEGRVPYKGPVQGVIHQMIGGLRSGMGYCGCPNIKSMHTKAQFVRISTAGSHESHVHSLQITKEAPNYSR